MQARVERQVCSSAQQAVLPDGVGGVGVAMFGLPVRPGLIACHGSQAVITKTQLSQFRYVPGNEPRDIGDEKQSSADA